MLVYAGAHAHLHLYNQQVLAPTGTPSAKAFGRWTRFHVVFMALKAPEKLYCSHRSLDIKREKERLCIYAKPLVMLITETL